MEYCRKCMKMNIVKIFITRFYRKIFIIKYSNLGMQQKAEWLSSHPLFEAQILRITLGRSNHMAFQKFGRCWPPTYISTAR